jgi:hypothetical protein
MLTIKQNLLETIKADGKPDRFVNQYEFLSLIFGDPVNMQDGRLIPGGPPARNKWGVYVNFPEGMPGPFPMHDPEHLLVKDPVHWKDYVHMPKMDFPEADWEPFIKQAEAIDRNQTFCAPMYATGVFEMLHYWMSIDDALAYFYEYPDEMHDMVKMITEYELKWADNIIKHVHPDALFHHDDWGTQYSSFISPAMFDDFILPAYKQIYAFWKENGVQLIVHHSDSYAANLVPEMIEVGIDIFQGCITTNNVPELVKKYGGQISFMGDLNNGVMDIEGWTKELIHSEVTRAIKNNWEAGGGHFYIPCMCMGGPESSYPGMYDAVTEEIKEQSKIYFK